MAQRILLTLSSIHLALSLLIPILYAVFILVVVVVVVVIATSVLLWYTVKIVVV